MVRGRAVALGCGSVRGSGVCRAAALQREELLRFRAVKLLKILQPDSPQTLLTLPRRPSESRPQTPRKQPQNSSNPPPLAGPRLGGGRLLGRGAHPGGGGGHGEARRGCCGCAPAPVCAGFGIFRNLWCFRPPPFCLVPEPLPVPPLKTQSRTPPPTTHRPPKRARFDAPTSPTAPLTPPLKPPSRGRRRGRVPPGRAAGDGEAQHRAHPQGGGPQSAGREEEGGAAWGLLLF